MKNKIWILPVLGLVLLFSSGCTSTVGYNPTYLPGDALRMNAPGKSLVVMSDTETGWVYSGSPTSFTGGGTTLQVPMGEITKQVALRVFGAAFTEGADFRTAAGNAQGYKLVVRPKVASFTYAFNQLKNLGFAITPTVTMELSVELSSPDGRALLSKTYSSGPTEGGSYALSGAPQEKINQLIHQSLFRLMTDAAQDAKAALKN